jgi:formiminoglutamase
VNNVIKYYRSPDPALWKGRLSNPSSLNQYWYEVIKFYYDGLEHLKSERLNSDFGILGYACDEGVKRNNGRQGAVNGPKAIREQLSKLSAQFSEKTVTDYGDIVAHENNIELAQKLFSNVIKEIIKSGQLSIGIGGSHDLAYGHFCGIQKALPKVKSTKIGILNFDAHFDLRPTINRANSGTPFYQIMKEFGTNVEYLALGIQKISNSNSLYKIASEFGVNHIPAEDCTLDNLNNVINIIDNNFKECNYLYVSIDLDGFTSEHAPGVSAPSPFGFSVNFFRSVFEHVLKTKNVVAIDIVELNPVYDIDSITAKLAAQIIDITIKKN